MSYQEREITLPSRPGSDDEEILVTALHWSGRNGGGSPALLIVAYMHHGIRYDMFLSKGTSSMLIEVCQNLRDPPMGRGSAHPG